MENLSDDESFDEDLLDSGNCYSIEGRRYNLEGLTKLLASRLPKDVAKLKSIVSAIAEQDCHQSFYHLLAEGYRVGVLNEDGQTALHLAFHNNANGILDWGNGYGLFNCESGENYTDCHGLSHLHIACAVNNPEMVRRFLERNEDVDARYGSSQFTPLHLAVSHRNVEVVVVLLNCSANVNAKDATGRTPIHLACGTSKTFERLMMSDGNLNEFDFESEMVIVRLLVERRCDLNVKDDEGNTPLFHVFTNEYFCREMWYQTERLSLKDELANEMRSRQAKKFELLLEYEVDVTTINNHGQNILHRIVSELKSLRFPLVYSNISFEDDYYANMIKRLVMNSNCKIDVNRKNERGETPLQLAMSFMSSTVMKVLLDHGADLDSLKFIYDQDKTCFDYPKIVPNLEAVLNVLDIVNLLMEKEFDITPETDLCILQFLVHDFDDCECSYARDIENTRHSVTNSLQYGSWRHFASATMRMVEASTMPVRMRETLRLAREIEMRIRLCRVCLLELGCKETFVEEVPRYLEYVDWKELMEEVKREVELMRSTKLEDDVSLYDVMIQHPRRIYRYVVNGLDFDEEGFKHCGVLIKRRVGECLVRRYVEKSAYDYFKDLLFSGIPDVCCRNLLMYLSNEDILNVCLASKLNF